MYNNREDVLPPAESGKFIANNAYHVKIHDEGIDKLSEEILLSIKSKLEIPDTGTNINYPSKEDSRAVDWIFVADALNFCFWSYKNDDKWTVEGYTGYYALEAALARALKEGYDITNPHFYSKISEEQLSKILRSDNNANIPLFQKRISVLHEVGAILIEKYDGTFKTCLKNANKSALKLLELIVKDFPCFRDEAMYKNRKVSLYKRAQILVSDIWNFFSGTGFGEFNDIDKITMFADYRVPQVLVYFNVLSYDGALIEKLNNEQLLENGSEEEVEIRGCSIHAIELIKKKVEEKLKSSQRNAQIPTSALIDYYLWCYRRKYANEMEHIPFHKTLSIYY